MSCYADAQRRGAMVSTYAQGVGYDDSMRQHSTPVLTQRVGEVALWCSLQELTAFHQDSAEEARRRELLKEANTLLATVKYKREGWLQRLLPGEERWTRAMNLLREPTLTHWRHWKINYEARS